MLFSVSSYPLFKLADLSALFNLNLVDCEVLVKRGSRNGMHTDETQRSMTGRRNLRLMIAEQGSRYEPSLNPEN